jgi:hypothetical protein
MTMALDFQNFVSDVANTIAEHLGVPETVEPIPDVAGGVETRRTLPDVFLLDHEKIVWHFPDITSRLIEEVP